MTASSPLEDLSFAEPSSRLPGFYRLDLRARHAELARRFGLTAEDVAALADGGALGVARADRMVENCVGVFGLPLALGLNFRVNGRDVAVPMAVEEPSIVAALSNSALLVRDAGGFHADADPSVMIAQIQVLDVADPEAARARVLAAKAALCRDADRLQPSMTRRGGGARDVEVRVLGADPPMLVVHPARLPRRHGRQHRQHRRRGPGARIEALTGGRVVPPHPLQPRRPAPGARALRHPRGALADGRALGRASRRGHRRGLALRRGGPVPRRDAQQGRDERHRRRRHRHRQRLARGRGRRARLRRARRALHPAQPGGARADGRLRGSIELPWLWAPWAGDHGPPAGALGAAQGPRRAAARASWPR
jgi:hypothetical protein